MWDNIKTYFVTQGIYIKHNNIEVPQYYDFKIFEWGKCCDSVTKSLQI